jgi:hypothetical protein
MIKKILVLAGLTLLGSFSFSQDLEKIINEKEAQRIERVLASDDMKGRKIFSPEIDKAAEFIAGEFKSAGLKTWGEGKTYLQEFAMVKARELSVEGSFDGRAFDPKTIMVITSLPDLKIDQSTSHEVVYIKKGSSLFELALNYACTPKNLLVMVDTNFARSFPRLSFLKSSLFKSPGATVFILGDTPPARFSISARHEIVEQKLANVVGVLPGKSKKDEYVIFSAHHDHIGTGKAVDGDSIYNGANDDAAGTTAVIMLAKYFAKQKNNERTLVFATFTAEESGGFGSRYFSSQFDPAKVMAMFNIEMVGTESKWGRNSAYITGFEMTDMGAILQKNLEGTGFKFYPDPYPDQQLFYRSDNATLARLGVPAHTISTSKMDIEPHYHKVSDHVETLDMANMAKVIQAIALSSRGIVAGKETPARVRVEELR